MGNSNAIDIPYKSADYVIEFCEELGLLQETGMDDMIEMAMWTIVYDVAWAFRGGEFHEEIIALYNNAATSKPKP